MNNVVVYSKHLKATSELPSHITHGEYLKLRMIPEERHVDSKFPNRNKFLIRRDKLFIDFTWETGGRIGDVVRIRKHHIDFENKILTLHIKKSKKTIKINLSDAICYEISNFYVAYPDKEPFEMTRQNAWHLVKKYGKMIGLKLHPHMFRHGLALYLLSKNVPIPIISYRLGHSTVQMTMDYYLRVTPQIEKMILEQIDFR